MNIKAFARGEGRQTLSALDQGCEERHGEIATAASGILPGLSSHCTTRGRATGVADWHQSLKLLLITGPTRT